MDRFNRPGEGVIENPAKMRANKSDGLTAYRLYLARTSADKVQLNLFEDYNNNVSTYPEGPALMDAPEGDKRGAIEDAYLQMMRALKADRMLT